MRRKFADRTVQPYDLDMDRLIAAIAGATLLVSAPGLGFAQKDDEGRVILTNKGARRVHREGEYGGVQPGVRGEGTRKCGKRKNRVSWVGFQEKGGGSSRVFVQMCSEMPYEQRVEGNKLVVTIEGARFLTRNARRALDTRYFDTSVLRVSSKTQRRRRAKRNRPAQAAGIRITITFKNSSDAREASASMSAAEDGYTYLFLDFGPPAESD